MRSSTKHCATEGHRPSTWRGRIVFLPSLASEHRNAIPATNTLPAPAHRTPVAGGADWGLFADVQLIIIHTTDLNVDASGRDFDEADTAPLAGNGSARRPPAAPVQRATTLSTLTRRHCHARVRSRAHSTGSGNGIPF